MAICDPSVITTIEETECLSESLEKINTNFSNLSGIACSLKERVESIRLSRTFFYYGPNSDIIAYNTDENSIPSDFTISTFVNSPDELDLQSISYPGDIVYIVYQKTGYRVFEDEVPILYDTSTGTIKTNTIFPPPINRRFPWLFPFSSASDFMLYRNVSIQNITTPPARSNFIYQRVDSNGRNLLNPVYTPTIIRNNNDKVQKYTVRWTVNNLQTANMALGDYTFEFSIQPGQELNFRSRMQTWLETNIGRHNVTINGTIDIQASNSFRNFISPRFTRRQPTQRTVNTPVSIFETRLTTSIDTDIETTPIFYIWKLTYENRAERGFNYYINNGWPKIHRAETTGIDGTNWNRPELWTTYNSWT